MKKHQFLVHFKFMAAIVLLSLSIIACKEEEVDDPNITYVKINKSITSPLNRNAVSDTIDVNADGVDDFRMFAVSTAAADTSLTYLYGSNALFYIDSTQTYSDTYKAKNLFKGEQPELMSTKTQWYFYAFTGAKTVPSSRGYAGVGDVFIPFMFLVGVNKHYGWMSIKVSSDYRTFKIIDAAFHLTPDTPIKMGAK